MSPEPESAAMAAFIKERQAGLLHRATEALAGCTDDELASEAHRLAGTLGTYQLPAGRDAMRLLQQHVTQPDATELTIRQARASTLAALARIAETLVDRDLEEEQA